MSSVSPLSANRNSHQDNGSASRQSPSISVSRNLQHHHQQSPSASTRVLTPIEQEREESKIQAQNDAAERYDSQMRLIKTRFDKVNSSRSSELADERHRLRLIISRTFNTNNHSNAQSTLEQLCKDALAYEYFSPHRRCLHNVERLAELREFAKIGDCDRNDESYDEDMMKIDKLIISDPVSEEYAKFQLELSHALENCEVLKNLFLDSFVVGTTPLTKTSSNNNNTNSSVTP